MSVLTAARVVLEDSTQPLPADVIYRRMTERGLWCNPHANHDAVVAGAIASEIGKHGAAALFRRAGDGSFTVRR